MAGCGSKSSTSQNAAVIKKAQTAQASSTAFETALQSRLGATQSRLGTWIFTLADGTTIYVLSGSGTVNLYRKAGDAVVADPSGNLGAKVVGSAADLSAVAAVLSSY